MRTLTTSRYIFQGLNKMCDNYVTISFKTSVTIVFLFKIFDKYVGRYYRIFR